jgi:hypothetical protein
MTEDMHFKKELQSWAIFPLPSDPGRPGEFPAVNEGVKKWK